MKVTLAGTTGGRRDRALLLRAHLVAGIGFGVLVAALVGVEALRRLGRQPRIDTPGSAPALPDLFAAVAAIALGTALAVGLPALLLARALRSSRGNRTAGLRTRARVAVGVTLLMEAVYLGLQLRDQWLSGDCSELHPVQALVASWFPLAVLLVTTPRRAAALDLALSGALRRGLRLFAVGLFLLLVTDDLRCPLPQLRGIWTVHFLQGGTDHVLPHARPATLTAQGPSA